MTATASTAVNPRPEAKLSKADAQHKQLVKQTQKWVAQTFYGQVLKQMRESPFKSELFSGGRGGQAFGEMLDQKLADHMSNSSGNKLVNAVVDKIEDKMHKRTDPTTHKRRRATSGINPTRLNVRA